MIQPGEFCRVTNKKDNLLKIKYNGQIYNLPSGREVVVPFEAAVLWFGDPRTIDKVQLLRDNNGKVQNMLPSRPDEIKRLRFKYGADLTGDESTFEETINGQRKPMENLPDVTVVDLDGNEITMVTSDPEGLYVLGGAVAPAINQNDSLLQIVKKQERQIQLLMKQLELEDVEDEAPANVTEGDLPTDDVAPTPRKYYNTDVGVPGPSMGELVK